MRIRAPRRLVALLALMCVLGGCQRSRERTVSVSEILKADASLTGQRVRTTAIVTYSDPDWHVLFVQDNEGGALYMGMPAGSQAEPGDMVEIRGIVSPGKELQKPTISVIDHNNPLPSPNSAANPSALVPFFLSQLVELSGTVQWSGMKSGLPAFQIWSRGTPLLIYVRHAITADLPSYGAEVKVSGVVALDVDSSGHLLNTAHLFTAYPRQIKLVRAGPSDPFTLPLRQLAELQKLAPGIAVHVRGQLSKTSEQPVITDGKISLPLELDKPLQSSAGAWEIAGFWNGHSLQNVIARRLSNQAVRNGDIVRLSDLKHLAVSDAAAHKPVSIRGVVTYFDPSWGLLFVQDETDGAFVDARNLALQIQPGDMVAVSGVSDPGQFAPMIAQPSIGFVKRVPLPTPVRLELLQGNWNSVESRWSSYRGVVHSARERDGHTILKIGYGRSDVTVQIPALIHGSDLVDQEFTATGVLGMVFNNRRQAIGHRLFVPSREFLLPVTGQPSQSGVLSIDFLQRYRPDDDERHTVTLNGTVVIKTAPGLNLHPGPNGRHSGAWGWAAERFTR